MVLRLCNPKKSDTCIVHMVFSSDSGIFKGEICSTIWYLGLRFETKATTSIPVGRKNHIYGFKYKMIKKGKAFLKLPHIV